VGVVLGIYLIFFEGLGIPGFTL